MECADSTLLHNHPVTAGAAFMHNRCIIIQVNEKSFELKRGNIGMVKKGRRQDWDGVVHNVCMVHKDSVCMHG